MSYSTLQRQATNITKREIRGKSWQIAREYDKALTEISNKIDIFYEKFLNATDPNNYYNNANKLNRLFNLFDEVQEAYATYARIANTKISEASEIAISNEFYRRQFVNSAFVPLGDVAKSATFAILDPVAIEMSVYGTEAKWKSIQDENRNRYGQLRPYKTEGDRPTLKRILYKNDRKAMRRIKDTITQGLIMGQSNAEMTSSLKSTFGMVKRNTARVVRTETHRNLSASQYASQQALKNQGFDVHRQLLSVLDSRTRRQSIQVNHRIDDENGFFTYPRGLKVRYQGNSGVAGYDINDRETSIEIIDGVSPTTRIGINPSTGKQEVIKFDQFPAWAKKNGLIKDDTGEFEYKRSRDTTNDTKPPYNTQKA